MALSHWIERHERAVAGASIVFFLALGVWMIANDAAIEDWWHGGGHYDFNPFPGVMG